MRNKLNQIEKLEEQIKDLRGKINEVLSSPYPYKIEAININYMKTRVRFTFQAADQEYFYQMIVSHMMDGNDVILIGEVYFFDEKGKTLVTGSGDAFRVMATVIEITRKVVTDQNIIKKYVESVSEELGNREINAPPMIEVLIFTADTSEPSRVRLYQRIAKNVPNFTLTHKTEGHFILFSDTLSSKKRRALGG